MPGQPAKLGVILVCCAALAAAPRRASWESPNGTPHDWDEVKNQRGGETGVGTTNFVEALVAA
jgi:hypothetical protein